MMAPAHAGLGWVIGMAMPSSDRRLRIWCMAAALVSDLDLLTILGGSALYDRLHLALGHNVLVGIFCVGLAAWYFRESSTLTWCMTFGLVGLCFASHLLLDLAFSGGEVRLFWPLSRTGVPAGAAPPALGFSLAILLTALPWTLAFWKRVTPLEIISPRLDTLFLNLLRRRKLDCSVCSKKCNNRCAACTKPVCFRHGTIDRRFRVTCFTCRTATAPKREGEAVDDYLARELRFIRAPEAIRLDPEFAAFLDRKLSDGLKRLDAVPRDNPLWQSSDHRPTLPKLMELSRILLKDSPDDEESSWVLFADKVRSNSPDLGFSAVEQLIQRDIASLRWLVAAARWSYLQSGVDPVLALRAPFESLGKRFGSVEECLKMLGGYPDPKIQQTGAQCLELMKGKNPFKPRVVVDPLDGRAIPSQPAYLRFVVGGSSEDAFEVARRLRDEGKLAPPEADRLQEIFDWFSKHISCPPFKEKRESGEWSGDAVAWFKDSAREAISQMWDVVALLKGHGVAVRCTRSEAPGKFVYDDASQVVVEGKGGAR